MGASFAAAPVTLPDEPPHPPVVHSGGEEGTLVRMASPTPSVPTPLNAAVLGPESGEDLLLGTTVGSFRIIRRLGKGGMGTVYLGEQTVIGSKVAVKFLHEALATNPGLVSRFYAEARSVNLIGHENIVNIFDMNVVPPSRYYLIMEYLDGKTLSSLARGPLPPEVAIPILTQVCDALHAAHSNGVVHRDLKPENIFLVKRGRNDNFVKLVDFGIAKLFADKLNEQTSAGMIIGTPEYMAPEQGSGEKVDGRADIYALGVIAYQLATGRLPFTGGGLTGMLIAHREKIPVPPTLLNPKLPDGLARVILKALEKRPEDRFQNADEMRDALDQALDAFLTRPRTAPIIPTPPPPTGLATGTPAPSQSRHPANFPARCRTAQGQELGELQAQDVSRGGVFLCSSVLPPVFTKVTVVLQTPGVDLACQGEVVRHVTPEQARAWSMSAGFGVQFTDPSAAFKESIARLVQGLPLDKAPAPVAAARARTVGEDPIAEAQLDFYRKRINGDHYVILAVMQDADFAEIRQRLRESIKDVEEIKLRPISDKQQGQITTILEKLKSAQETLGTPARRAEFDGLRGNFRGVARCIANGLTVTELEQIRARVLAQRQTHDSRAQIAFATGSAWEGKGQLPLALEQYEQALTLDALNLRYHQRYWGLKKRPPPQKP